MISRHCHTQWLSCIDVGRVMNTMDTDQGHVSKVDAAIEGSEQLLS